jgi:hypothetical protein
MFAAGYDHFMAGTEQETMRPHREALIPQASGRVLEIGGGTGANLEFYGEGVRSASPSTSPPTGCGCRGGGSRS